MPHLVSRSRRLPPFLAMMLLACLAFGAGLSPSAAQEWKVNKAKSRVSFELSLEGQPVEGQFGAFKVEIRFDPEEPADGEISAILDAASARTGDAGSDATLASSNWLDSTTHPAIRFTSLGIKEVDNGRYRMDANLTIKGVTKRVAIPLAIEDDGADGKVRAEIKAGRAAFGIGPAENDGDIRIVLDLAATHLTN